MTLVWCWNTAACPLLGQLVAVRDAGPVLGERAAPQPSGRATRVTVTPAPCGRRWSCAGPTSRTQLDVGIRPHRAPADIDTPALTATSYGRTDRATSPHFSLNLKGDGRRRQSHPRHATCTPPGNGWCTGAPVTVLTSATPHPPPTSTDGYGWAIRHSASGRGKAAELAGAGRCGLEHINGDHLGRTGRCLYTRRRKSDSPGLLFAAVSPCPASAVVAARTLRSATVCPIDPSSRGVVLRSAGSAAGASTYLRSASTAS